MNFRVTIGPTTVVHWIFKKQWYYVTTHLENPNGSGTVTVRFDPYDPDTMFVCLTKETEEFFKVTSAAYAFDCILHSVDWKSILDDADLHEGEELQFNPRCHAVEPICGMTSKYFTNY